MFNFFYERRPVLEQSFTIERRLCQVLSPRQNSWFKRMASSSLICLRRSSSSLLIATSNVLTISGRGDAREAIARSIREQGGQATFVRTDVSRSVEITRLFDSYMQRCGQLDILSNNASYEGPGTSFADTSEEELDKVIATNFKSVFLACKLAAPIMTKARAGSIMNTTAGSAREGMAWSNLAAYIGRKARLFH